MSTEVIEISAPGGGAGFDILQTQVFVFAVVFLAFWLGVWARGALDDDLPAMTPRQMLATALVGFVLLAYPLAHLVQEAWSQAHMERRIDALMAACVPIMVTGVTAREQILRWFTNRFAGAASRDVS